MQQKYQWLFNPSDGVGEPDPTAGPDQSDPMTQWRIPPATKPFKMVPDFIMAQVEGITKHVCTSCGKGYTYKGWAKKHSCWWLN